MYGESNKVVCGTIFNAILFYEKFIGQLLEWGFEMNTYIQYIFKKMINGKHITVQYHVDNCIFQSERESDIEDIIKILNNKFRTKTK